MMTCAPQLTCVAPETLLGPVLHLLPCMIVRLGMESRLCHTECIACPVDQSGSVGRPPADGRDAEIVWESMRQAKLRADAIAEFTVSDLLKLHRHGYTSALRIEAAQRPDLEKSELNPALVGVLLKAIEGIRILL